MIHTHAVDAMATRFEFALEGDDAAFLRDVAEEAGEAILECHARFNRFDPASLLSFISRTAHERPVRLDVETFELLELAMRVGRESEGAFDIAIGGAMEAAGFRDVLARAPAEARGQRVASASRPGGGIALDHERRAIAFDAPGVTLDLGGIAKGFALDRAAEIVREHGIPNALLHGGTSSVVAIGRPANAAGFRVRLDRTDCLMVDLRDEALSVSAPHGRMIEAGDCDEPRGHVLDPRTCESTAKQRLAAVVAPTAAESDAWSTAIIAAGGIPSAIPAHLSVLTIDQDDVVERRGPDRWRATESALSAKRVQAADPSAKVFAHV
jgi:thiamine biosynthesis lipoprotein